MTRLSQKQEELRILRAVLSSIGLDPYSAAEAGENPDFMVRIAGRIIGVEVTMFRSNKTISGFGYTLSRRSVESEWERIESFAKEFRKQNAELQNTYILFRFMSVVPSRKEYQGFFEEILQFVRLRLGALTEGFTTFGTTDFMSPLMTKYLKPIGGLTLRKCESGAWDSNLNAGFVDGCPAHTVSKIVADKAAKTYRKAEELWLVIGQSGRLSEMVLPIDGALGFDASSELRESLRFSPFSRVSVLSASGLLQWGKGKGKWEINVE